MSTYKDFIDKICFGIEILKDKYQIIFVITIIRDSC